MNDMQTMSHENSGLCWCGPNNHGPERGPAPQLIRVKAHKVCAGMTVIIAGEPGEWTTLSRHPKGGHWWLHRWTDADVWETSHAHYSHMMQIIKEPGE